MTSGSKKNYFSIVHFIKQQPIRLNVAIPNSSKGAGEQMRALTARQLSCLRQQSNRSNQLLFVTSTPYLAFEFFLKPVSLRDLAHGSKFFQRLFPRIDR